MEKARDRWWPQCAAVYGMVLTKHLIGVHPLSELEPTFDGNTVVLSMVRLAKQFSDGLYINDEFGE